MLAGKTPTQNIQWPSRTFCCALALLVWTSPSFAFKNNGFDTDWIYALKTNDSSLVALRESDGATMATLITPMDFNDPNVLPWPTLTFSGTAVNNDARLYLAQATPNQISGVQDSNNARVAEINASGGFIRTITISSLLPGAPSTLGANVRVANIRYSRYHGALFLALDRDYRDDNSPPTIYELDLGLTRIINTYTPGTLCHHDEPNLEVNSDTGELYLTEMNLGQPPRSQMAENGQGDLISISTANGSTSQFKVIVDGPTYSAIDSRWSNPGCPVYRGTHNPSGRPSLLMLLHGPTTSQWPQLEFFLDATDGLYPPAGNLALRGSPFTSQRFAWRGQLDEVANTVMATRLNQNNGTPGIDLIAPNDSTRLIGSGIGWQDADSPGIGTSQPPIALAGMPQRDPQDARLFRVDDRPWYPVGYYPGLGAINIRGAGTTREEYYMALIDAMADNGVNYFRTVFDMGQALDWGVSVQTLAYVVTGTRNVTVTGHNIVVPIVDLNQFYEPHFAFWRSLIQYARNKGVVVQLCLRESWHNNQFTRSNDDYEWGQIFDFYATSNNVNGIALTTENQWHSTDASSTAWGLHTAMVRKCIDEFGDLPNIVWEVCNEPRPYYDGTDPAESGKTPNNWTILLGDYLKTYEQGKWGYTHLCMPIDLPDHQHTGGQRPDFFLTAATETDGHTPQGTHRDMLYQLLNDIPAALPQPLIADNDAPNSDLTADGRRQKSWAALTTGGFSDYFHYTMTSVSAIQSSDVQDAMRYTGYVNRFLNTLNVNMRGMTPSDSLVNNGWCYARSGHEFIIYLINGGTTTVSNLPSTYAATWYNPRNGAIMTANSGPTFVAPDINDWALYIVEAEGPPPTVRADFDHDNDVDQIDFSHIQSCITGPNVGALGNCLDADLDFDTDVDQLDLGIFIACIGGSNLPPLCAPW